MSNCYWYSIIDTHPGYGYCCAIDVDSNHQPHISYFAGGRNLRYAKKDGGVWFNEEIDPPSHYPSWWTTSIKINPITDLPALAYTDPNTYQLKYVWDDGAIWHIDTVDDYGFIGTQKALDFDSLGNPYIIASGRLVKSFPLATCYFFGLGRHR